MPRGIPREKTDKNILDLPWDEARAKGADLEEWKKNNRINMVAHCKESKRVCIKIPKTKEDTEDVPVSVNGYVIKIKRDEWVDIPECYVHNLDNAIEVTYHQKKTENGMEWIESESPSYPYMRKG